MFDILIGYIYLYIKIRKIHSMQLQLRVKIAPSTAALNLSTLYEQPLAMF